MKAVRTREPNPRRVRKNVRARAVRSGKIPPARQAFPLFCKDGWQATGSDRASFAAEMKRLGALWRTLPETEKLKYRNVSHVEWSKQAQVMRQLGIPRRCGSKRAQALVEAREEQRSSTQAPSATQIGPFEVERLLGSGTYGTVYMAHSTSGQALAVKVFKHGCPAMKRELTQHEGLTAMSSQMRRLFADIVESDVGGVPLPWIAFEYGGITVQEVMPLSSKDVWVIARQLQSALRCLHEKAQIVHLDCKPPNVLWSKSCERVVLIDLGMAERLDGDLPRSVDFVSYVSPAYRPPELWGAKCGMLRSLLVPQVDMFSYGAVLFFMLSNSKVLFPLTRAVTHDVPMSLMQWCRQHSALLGLTSCPNNAVRKQLGEEFLSVYDKLCEVCPCPWRQTILDLCNPSATKRKWPELSLPRPVLQRHRL